MGNEEDFGSYIRSLRGDKSLREIEAQTGVTSSFLSKLERGERGVPKPETIKKLAFALSENYYELMEKAGYIEADHNSNEQIVVNENDLEYFNLMKDLQKRGYTPDDIRRLVMEKEEKKLDF